MGGEILQIGSAGHRSVRFEDFANSCSRGTACESGQIDGSLGMAAAAKDSPIMSNEREYMPGPGKIISLCIGSGQMHDRPGTFEGRNPRSRITMIY